MTQMQSAQQLNHVNKISRTSSDIALQNSFTKHWNLDNTWLNKTDIQVVDIESTCSESRVSIDSIGVKILQAVYSEVYNLMLLPDAKNALEDVLYEIQNISEYYSNRVSCINALSEPLANVDEMFINNMDILHKSEPLSFREVE